MGQTLTNGIYLPNEGERNCYSGLAANWNAVDTLKGNYSLHVINVDIHVTAAEKETWNGKADNSALTAHTGDTTIHVTSADKQAWNGHVADTTIHVTSADKQAWNEHVADTVKHVTASDKQTWNGKQDALSQTQLDAVNSGIDSSKVQQIATNTSDISSLQSGKANDSDVVHKSGNETIAGEKTFNNVVPINGVYIGNEPSTTFRTLLLLRSRYDTAGKSGWLVSKFRSNSAQGALSGSDTVFLNFDVLENEVRTNGVLRFNLSSWSGNTPGRFSLIPNSAIESYLGTSGNKWKAINGLEPSALGMPDLANGIDISSYITDLTGTSNINKYTPTVNGWLSIGLSGADFIELYIPSSLIGGSFTKSTVNRYAMAFMPVIANKEVRITLKGSSIGWAKFYPCLGNV